MAKTVNLSSYHKFTIKVQVLQKFHCFELFIATFFYITVFPMLTQKDCAERCCHKFF